MQRFEQRYLKRQSVPCGALRKWGTMAAGLLMVLVGVVLLPLPGPGMLVVLAGAALMANHSLFVARLLDRAELAVQPAIRYLRERFSRTPRRRAAASRRDRRTFRPQ